MFYKSIIDICDPLAHWTGENFSAGVNGNVYDEYGNYDLLNQNAGTDSLGQTNNNFSNKSMNLKGGHLIVPDATFLGPQITAKNFQIHFNFKTDTTVVGAKPLISKWSPEQQFWIGFENGGLVGKFMTDGGLEEIVWWISEAPMLFSGRWNHVTMRVTSGNIYLYVNGKTNSNVATTSIMELSTSSQFTVGAVGAEAFTTDVYINDIAITTDDNGYLPHAVYKLPRSDRDMWLDLHADYLFFISDYFSIDPEKPVPNEGTGGGYGYIQTDSATLPYLTRFNNAVAEEGVHCSENSWFTIDDDLDFDPTNNGGWTVICDGGVDGGDTTSSSTNSFKFRYVDVKRGATDDIERILISDERADSNYHWHGIQTYNNTTGAIQQVIDRNEGANNRASYYDNGANLVRFNIRDDYIYSTTIPTRYWYNAQSITNTMSPGLAPLNQPWKYNRFWWNLNADSYVWTRLRVLCVADRDIFNSRVEMIKYQRTILMQHFIQNHGHGIRLMMYGIENVTTPQIRDWKSGPSDNLTNCQVSSWVNSNYDGLANRQNELPSSLYLASTSNWIGQDGYEDFNYLSANNFTLNMFIRNLNTTSRYELCSYTTSPGGSCDLNYGTRKFSIYMNSRNGVFSQGDVEVGYNNLAAGYTWSTESKKFLDDGWHMLTITRDGAYNATFIDGIIDTRYTASGIYDCGTSNTSWRVYGGPVYVSEWAYWRTVPLDQNYIEFVFRGYSDVMKGKTLLSGAPIESKLLAIHHDTGRLVQTDSSDAVTGEFEFQIPKDVTQKNLDVLALPVDPTATNNIVVHGPYNAHTTYSRYVEEIFTGSLKDMIIDMDPMAYYPLDDTSGLVAVEASGNHGDGTYTGGVVLGRPGPSEGILAADFTASSSQYVDLPDGFADLTNGYTFEAWVKSETSTSWARIITVATAINGVNEVYMTRNSSGTTFQAGFNGGVAASKTGILINSIWRHCVFRQRPDFSVELWVDGILVGTNTGASAPANVTRTFNRIGGNNYTADAYWDGLICNAAVYDYCLPAEEIKKHAARGKGFNIKTMRSTILTDNPIAYWTFDRLDAITDVTNNYVMVATGSYTIDRNALVINGGTIGNNYLQISNATFTTPAGSFSMEVSAKIPGGTQTDAIIVSEWDQSVPSGLYKLMIDSSNTFKLMFGTDATFLQSSTVYNDGDWHHIVVTYNGTTLFLYVDGTAEDSVVTSLSGHGVNNLTVGNDSTGIGTHFLEARGDIDDLAYYDTNLSTTQVEDHYSQFLEKKTTQ